MTTTRSRWPVNVLHDAGDTGVPITSQASSGL